MDSRHLSRLLVATLMCVAMSSISMCFGESAHHTGKPPATVLSGSVEHVEVLGSVDENLRPGKPFLQSQLPKLDDWTNGRWCRIPNWMAGKDWVHEQSTSVYREDLRAHTVDTTQTTETDSGIETWGWQRDKNGDTWQYNPAPFMSRDDGDKEFTVHLHHEPWETVSFEPDRMVFRAVGTHIDVDKQSNLITNATQAETILVFTPIAEGVMRTDYSAKIFDEDGQPKSLRKSFRINRRQVPFEAWNYHNGRDVRTAFYQFLAANGMSHLIPPQANGKDATVVPGTSVGRSGIPEMVKPNLVRRGQKH